MSKFEKAKGAQSQLNRRLEINKSLDFDFLRPQSKAAESSTMAPLKPKPACSSKTSVGTKNQGEGNSCPTHAAAFVHYFLKGEEFNSEFIDRELIDNGKNEFQEMLENEERKMNHKDIDPASAQRLSQDERKDPHPSNNQAWLEFASPVSCLLKDSAAFNRALFLVRFEALQT